MKTIIEMTVCVALIFGTYAYFKNNENHKIAELQEALIDEEAYIHELQAQLARDDAIIHVMEDGATKRQAEHVVDSASAYGVDLK